MVYFFLKRVFDLIGASLGLLIFSPLMILAAILIKLTSDGPVLVENSDRVGQKGKTFRMYKFRSMVKDSHKLLRTDPKYKELLTQYKKNNFKLEKDPRITPVGALLRKTSIDELPQFFNVLKSEMSLIGPRAYYSDELAEQRKKFPRCNELIETSLQAKPGITGLWQVSGRSSIGFEDRIELDATYARAKSLWLDFKILLKTPFAIWRGEGL